MAKQRERDWPLPDSPEGYAPLLERIASLPPEDADALIRETAVNDFWFFVRYVTLFGNYLCDDPFLPDFYGKRPWAEHPWVFQFCRDIQRDPDDVIVLAPRFHFKSTLITQYLTLWDLIDNPNLRVLILSYKKQGTGEGFVVGIKTEAENNRALVRLWPGVFWTDPGKQAPAWSSSALTFIRTTGAKEPSVMVAGLVGGSVTSLHFDVKVIDDPVVEQSVATEGAIEATNSALRSSTGTGASHTRTRYVGTRWAWNDSWKFLTRELGVRVRHYPVMEDGKPVLRSKQWCDTWRTSMGEYNWSCQMENAPRSGGALWFSPRHIRHTDSKSAPPGGYCYIVVDPASEEKKDSDYTSMLVWSIGRSVGDEPPLRVVLDLSWDKINLSETTEILFGLVERWRPKKVFYEKFGSQRDHEPIREKMAERGLAFTLVPFQDKTPKVDRIKRLQPVLERGGILLPRSLTRTQIYSGRQVDLARRLRDELIGWDPKANVGHDDLVDALAFTVSPAVVAPPPPRPFSGPAARRPQEWDPWAI